MAYSDFKLRDIKENLGLTLRERQNLFTEVKPILYSDHLRETLAYNVPLATSINTEKARSEMIVTPVLVEVIKQRAQAISLFSGVEFNVDKARGLNGVCDFIISLSPEQFLLEVPVITIVEAKNDNLKSGLGQCIAEMYAAQLYNASKNITVPTVYGTVTTGSLWRFLSLTGKTVTIDRDEYHISNVAKIVGVMMMMVGDDDAG